MFLIIAMALLNSTILFLYVAYDLLVVARVFLNITIPSPIVTKGLRIIAIMFLIITFAPLVYIIIFTGRILTVSR